MSDAITNSASNLKPGFRLGKIEWRYAAWFTVAAAIGGVATLYPWVSLGLMGLVVFVGLCWLTLVYIRRADLEIWQVLLLMALSGYLLLNYGFENVAIHIAGIPIIISYGLMYSALAVALVSRRRLVAAGLQEPAVRCILILIGFTSLRLLWQVPHYGLMAIRDATMCLDGLFMLLGLAWAMKKNSLVFLTKWMMLIFALNMLYSFTQPWQEQIWSWSPESGVFLPVAIFGNFNGIGDLLMTGALFCICVGSFVIKRPSWLLQVLIVGQFLGFALAQVRRMYVAAAVVLLILIFMGEVKKFAKLLFLLPAGLIVILLVTSISGIEINGRIGAVNLEFFKEHIRSIHDSEGTPGSAVETRFDMADEALGHFYAHPIFGVGFGQPLLTDIDMRNGAVTRMPHDSSLTFLARLGVVGFAVWIAFHFCIIRAFIHALRQRRHCPDGRLAAFVLWAFLFYVLFMIGSLVEAPFEFPSGAVPFYFFMGLTLGLIRKNFYGKPAQARLTTLNKQLA